jgi:hypothetical protein
MHKNATKCNETLSKWCKNKHGASKIIDTFETYQSSSQRNGFSKILQRLNLGSFEITKLKIHLVDSTYKQVVGIKHNVLVQIKRCPTLIDFVIVDMPEDAIAPIILGRPFLKTVKALINFHEGNVRFELPSREPFVMHFPRKKKNK